jgi:hypothetical protein
MKPSRRLALEKTITNIPLPYEAETGFSNAPFLISEDPLEDNREPTTNPFHQNENLILNASAEREHRLALHLLRMPGETANRSLKNRIRETLKDASGRGKPTISLKINKERRLGDHKLDSHQVAIAAKEVIKQLSHKSAFRKHSTRIKVRDDGPFWSLAISHQKSHK